MPVKDRKEKQIENLEKLKLLRPIDDEFARCLYQGNLALAQETLRIILQRKDIRLVEVQTQREIHRLMGARSVTLDVYAKDDRGRLYDLEFQRSGSSSLFQRARYYSSMLDLESLNAGDNYDSLPETYVIFLMEHDLFHQNEPVYPVERVNLKTGTLMQDQAHILFVNTDFRDHSPFGKLMQDLKCADAAQMRTPFLSKAAHFFKEHKKGRSMMSAILDDLRKQEREEGRLEGREEGREEEKRSMAKSLIRDTNLTYEEVSRISGLSVEELLLLV